MSKVDRHPSRQTAAVRPIAGLPPGVRLPKDALKKIDLGQSFAEYDPLLAHRDVFVRTPAIEAAEAPVRGKCFYVGRRGTGKTATTLYVRARNKHAVQILPLQFVPDTLPDGVGDFKDTRQRPFKSLVIAFKRSLLDEALAYWIRSGITTFNGLPERILRERNAIEQLTFDARLLAFYDAILEPLAQKNEKEWLRQIRNCTDLAAAIDEAADDNQEPTILLIDRIDEAWDGSDSAVLFLMALMHACVQLFAETRSVRPLLFLRENIFERVRQVDNEFGRLETAVVSLDWTPAHLLELVERRLNVPFNTKLPLRGPTWEYFFEPTAAGPSSILVFEYCQHRPRDVLTYCGFAIEAAQSNNHDSVKIEDLQAAKKRFSDSRLKDLGDEYSENYPQVRLVLSRFFGLGREFTIAGIDHFIKRLLTDPDIKAQCSTWIFRYTVPEHFIELLYNLGFAGIKDGNDVQYRSLGVRAPTAPRITPATVVVIHPSYADALQLQDKLVTSIEEGAALRAGGLVFDLPEALDLTGYTKALGEIETELATIPKGKPGATAFEDVVGDIIRLCFYRYLTNVEPKSRSVDGTVIRDWIASNTAPGGFWEMIRLKYAATQIIWECKNYDELAADDFHQVNYYQNDTIGRFSIIVFRGERQNRYFEHLRRVNRDGGMVLLITERDLQTFVRQAKNGKWRETHIQEIYDATVRALS